MAVEGIKRGLDTEIKPRLDHPEVLDALRRGNVQDVIRTLPSGVTKAEVEEYLKHQWVVLDQGLLQNVQIKAEPGAVPPVTMDDMLPMSADHSLTPEERALLQQGLGMYKAAAVGKGAGLGDGKAAGDTKGPVKVGSSQATGGVGAEQLTGMVEDHLAEFNAFMNEIQDKILEVQMTMEMESRKHELQKETQRIISLFRSGQMDPEYVLIALAKVQISQRGLLFTQYGRRMMHANDVQSRIAKEIGNVGADPTKWGGLEVARHKMAEQSMNMQQYTSMLQKLTQDIEAIFGFAKGASESIINTKKEIVRHIGAGSSS